MTEKLINLHVRASGDSNFIKDIQYSRSDYRREKLAPVFKIVIFALFMRKILRLNKVMITNQKTGGSLPPR